MKHVYDFLRALAWGATHDPNFKRHQLVNVFWDLEEIDRIRSYRERLFYGYCEIRYGFHFFRLPDRWYHQKEFDEQLEEIPF